MRIPSSPDTTLASLFAATCPLYPDVECAARMICAKSPSMNIIPRVHRIMSDTSCIVSTMTSMTLSVFVISDSDMFLVCVCCFWFMLTKPQTRRSNSRLNRLRVRMMNRRSNRPTRLPNLRTCLVVVGRSTRCR